MGLHKALALNTAAAHPRPTSPPKLAADELLVRVRASSLQHMDYILPEVPYGMSRLAVRPPASPGMDFAGHIVASRANRVRDNDNNKTMASGTLFSDV